MKNKRILLTILILFSFLYTSVAFASDNVAITESTEEVTRVEELIEKRDLTSKTYLMSDGTYQWEGYAENIHYISNNEYKEIKNDVIAEKTKISEIDYLYKNEANAFTVRFADNDDTKYPVYIGVGDSSISFGFDNSGISKVSGIAEVKNQDLQEIVDLSASKVYEDVYPDTDIVYEVRSTAIKEYIVLNSNTGINEFTYNIKLDNVTISQENDSIIFSNAKGEQLFKVANLYAFDSQGKPSNNVACRVEGTDSEVKLVVSVDKEFLDAAGTVYPVYIDPTVEFITGASDTYDTYASSRYITTNYYLSTLIRTGYNSSYYERNTYIKFDLPSVDESISSAYLKLKLYDAIGIQRPIAYRVLSSWSSSSLTWSNKPSHTSTYNSGIGSSLGNYWYNMDVTDIVTRWDNGTYSNYGFCVRDYDNDNFSYAGAWHSSDAVSGINKPRLIINYGTPIAVAYGWDLEALLGGYNIISSITSANAYNKFDDMGYLRYHYNSSNAATVRNNMSVRAITLIGSHGSPGTMEIYYSDGSKTILSADATSNPLAYSLENRYCTGAYSIDPTRLVLYVGCNTGNTDATYGNLLERSAEYGADAAVGFSTEIYFGYQASDAWSEELFEELDNGDTLSTALYDAMIAVYYYDSQYNYYNFNNYVIDGALASPGGVTVDPATHGQ